MEVGDWLLGAALAFVIATATTPAGISGAVLLVPVQVSVLNVANPAVTPTNLLYNVVATPGALLRFRREGTLATTLTKLLILGTLPGVVIGGIIRVELLSGPDAFLVVIGAVLLPLGVWLLLSTPTPTGPALSESRIVGLSLVVGVVGGIYGIGGGSILAPILVGAGWSVREVAPAALASTFVASVAGVLTFAALSLLDTGANVAPEWVLGIALGIGGLGGAYVGARLQPRIPEKLLRRGLGLAAAVVALRYLVVGLT